MLPSERLDYSAIAERQKLALPQGARLAVWLIVNVEEWDPTRPMPPSSSRPKHSAGLSVRRARSPAADPRAGDSRSGTALSAPPVPADPFPGVIISTSAMRGLSWMFSLVLRRQRALRTEVPAGRAVGPGATAERAAACNGGDARP